MSAGRWCGPWRSAQGLSEVQVAVMKKLDSRAPVTAEPSSKRRHWVPEAASGEAVAKEVTVSMQAGRQAPPKKKTLLHE